MDDKQIERLQILTLAFGIALLPPIWAVLAPFMGVKVGSVALICAGLYVTNGNQRKDAFKIASGFILGDLWAVIAIWLMETVSWNPNIELFITLFMMGGLAVIIGETFKKYIFTPAWLCGWAIGLTIMGALKIEDIGSLPLQIGIAMIVGVVYVGMGVDAFQKFLIKRFKNKNEHVIKK